MKCSRLFMAIAVAACSLGGQAMAAISAGAPLQVVSGGQAPGSPIDYDFGDFGNAGKPTLLTNFAVSVVGDLQYAGNIDYTTVIAPDGTGPFLTGIAYFDSPPAVQTQVVATFSPLFDGGFTVWILDANTDGNFVGNTSVGLGVNGGPAISTATVYNGVNEFTPFFVTNALTTDVFQVYATTGTTNFASLGGLTFSQTTVPEAGTIALVLPALGIIGAVAVRRKRTITS